MMVDSQPPLSYLPDGWAHLVLGSRYSYISRVTSHFYSASLSPRDQTLIWNVRLPQLQHMVNFNMDAMLINIYTGMKGIHTHIYKSPIIKFLRKPPSVHQGKGALKHRLASCKTSFWKISKWLE